MDTRYLMFTDVADSTCYMIFTGVEYMLPMLTGVEYMLPDVHRFGVHAT